MVDVTSLEPKDREAWEALFRGYIAFYQREVPQGMYDRAWLLDDRDDERHGPSAVRPGRRGPGFMVYRIPL